MIRSVLAVLGGFVVLAILVGVGTMLAAKLFLPDAMPGQPQQPNAKYLAANLLLSAFAAAAGGYVAALGAGRMPLLHASILAAVILVLGAVSAFRGAQPGQPGWYPFVLMLLGPCGALLGGWVRSLS